jgi:hypothetical protein
MCRVFQDCILFSITYLSQLGKVIRPLSVSLFNTPMSFNLQILKVRTCSNSRPPRGRFRIQMMGSAITLAREVIFLVLAPHVFAPTRL